MVKLKFDPCGTCCGCESVNDNFDRASLGSNWVQDVGSWSISSNQATTSSAPAAMYHSSSSQNFAEVDLVAASGNARVCIRYTDEDNYLYADITSGGFVRAGRRASGTDTPLGSGSSGGGVPGTYTVCYDAANDIIRIQDGASINISETVGTPGSGTRSGLASIAGTSTFDNFRSWEFDQTNTDCPDCLAACTKCDVCDGPSDCGIATTITIKFEGWASIPQGFGQPPLTPNGVYTLTGGSGVWPQKCIHYLNVTNPNNPLFGKTLEYHTNNTSNTICCGDLAIWDDYLPLPDGFKSGLFVHGTYQSFGTYPAQGDYPCHVFGSGNFNQSCHDNSLFWIDTGQLADCDNDLTGFALDRHANGFLSAYYQDGATVELL